jgi:hypothetical protein
MIPDEEECFKQLKHAYDQGINVSVHPLRVTFLRLVS